MAKRFNYGMEFGADQQEEQVEFPRRVRRKYVNDENQLPYRNCIGRYQNGYHFGLKEELKQNQRNLIYLRHLSREREATNVLEPLQSESQTKRVIIEKIHTISEHCEDDENETIVFQEEIFDCDLLY